MSYILQKLVDFSTVSLLPALLLCPSRERGCRQRKNGEGEENSQLNFLRRNPHDGHTIEKRRGFISSSFCPQFNAPVSPFLLFLRPPRRRGTRIKDFLLLFPCPQKPSSNAISCSFYFLCVQPPLGLFMGNGGKEKTTQGYRSPPLRFNAT